MSHTIDMLCPGCLRTERVERTAQDPAIAVLLEIACPDCAPDFPPTAKWFDAAGNLVFGYAVEGAEPVQPAATA